LSGGGSKRINKKGYSDAWSFDVDINSKYQSRTGRSKKLYARACDIFPGGVSHNLRLYKPYPVYPVKAGGARFIDVDGNEYIDLWMGHYALILGHAASCVSDAVSGELAKGWHWGMTSEAEIMLAEKIRSAIPSMQEMRFCTTGTEATMYAVRLARASSGKTAVLKVAGGWHGANSDLSFAVKPPFDSPEGPGFDAFESGAVEAIEFNDIEKTQRVIDAHRGRIACIIIEPMIGAGGFVPARKEYLHYLRSVCDEEGIVLIFDEIITGFRFRYGSLADEYGVTPDLTVLGKIVGGGLPIGIYGGKRDIMAPANPALKSSGAKPALVGGGTFSSHPLTMAAALATLEKLEEDQSTLYPALAEHGDIVRKGVEDRFKAAGLDVACTGKGSLFMAHLLRGEDRSLQSPTEIVRKTFSEFKDRELKTSLMNNGLFSVHGGGSLSAAHLEKAELDSLLAAYERAAEDFKGADHCR